MRRAAPESRASRFWLPFVAFAVAVVPPVFLARAGDVAVHQRTRLLVDPGAALSDALSVWDPDRALGTVAADELTRAWPLATFHWLCDAVAIPTWAAQRLWFAGILLAACGGVLFLTRAWRWRPAAGAAAGFTYGLTPFVVAGLVEPEALLPFAGLPWLLGLTVLALRHRGWRHPALFGLVLTTVASSDATAAVLVVAAALAWVAHAVWISEEVTRARAATTLTKIGIVTVAVNAWWLAARTVQATNGVDAARFVGPPEVVNQTSSATEVLRGLGRWTAYASDAAASARYTQESWLLVASFAIPVVAVLALGIARWRHRTFAIGLFVVGAVLAVGAHPPGSPSPYGALVRAVERTEPGLALRGLQEAVVLVVLGTALGIGALVGAAGEEDVRRAVAGAAAAFGIAAMALAPLWTGDLVPGEELRRELVPDELAELAAALDDGDDESRVLELPAPPPPPVGTNAAPAGLDAVLERGYVARRAVPSGSAAAADLLRALDRPAQEGTLDPAALAPVARLLGVGDVVVPAGSPAPGLLEDAAGVEDVRTVGGARTASVEAPMPVVRTLPEDDVVLLSGSGAGIVDAAGAGLLEGDELIRYSSALTDDPDFARTHLRDDRLLVVTDTNRARAQRWTDVRDVDGFTETVEGGLLDDDPFDHRLAVQDGRPGTTSVTETGALSVRATDYGPTDHYAPEHRPVLAADGDPETSWVVSATDAVGERIELTAAEPLTVDAVRLLQATQAGGPAITEVTLRFDGEDPVEVELDGRSLEAPGQLVEIGERSLSRVSVEIDAVEPDGGSTGMTGFAEIDVGGLVADEVVRMPSDLLDAAGFRSTRYPLALVQTRLRDDAGSATPEERSIRRIVELPATRPYLLSGRAHPTSGTAPTLGACRDDLVAVDGEPIPVRLVDGPGDDLRLEGCAVEGVTIPGGERRFTTAPGEETGVHVDQLLWLSAPLAGRGSTDPAPAGGAPRLEVTGSSDTTVDVEISGAEPGEPFWLVLGQSYDEGWEVLDADAEVDGPHLVNGYANGFLVTPDARALGFTLRFVPQNRVDVALLVSAGAVLVALVLALSPAPEVRPAPIAGQEPLRRLRALTYEGALPTRRDAVVVAVIGGVGGALLAGPLVGVALAAVGGFATRREGWRPALTVGPALLLVVAAAAVVLEQVEQDLPHSLDWPASTGGWHRIALTAVLLLALDLVIDHVWRRRALHD